MESLNLHERLKSGANAGLIYNKYFGMFIPADSAGRDKKRDDADKIAKQIAISCLVDGLQKTLNFDGTHFLLVPCNGRVKNEFHKSREEAPSASKEEALNKKLQMYHDQQSKRLEAVFEHLSVSQSFACAGNLLCGVGDPHPTGNNLSFHPTLGVPYLPGSSIKGALRNYIVEVMGGVESELGKNENLLLTRLFGKGISKDDNSSIPGRYIFYDAIPTAAPSYAVDIMTPHYGKWYELGGKDVKEATKNKKDECAQSKVGNNLIQGDKIPNEWHEPVPIEFLTVSKPTLKFCITPAAWNKKSDTHKADLEFLFSMLKAMLQFHGIGAKTRSGYGFFNPVNAD